MTREMKQMIDDCLNCHAVCMETMSLCLESGCDAKMTKMLLMCAQTCIMCADMSSTGMQLADRISALCAESCEMCADMCDKSGDERVRACADVCRRCAKSCRMTARAAA